MTFEARIGLPVSATDPAVWERALPGAAEAFPYYLACERSGRGAFELSGARVLKDGQAVAVAPAFKVVYRLDTSLQGPLRRISDGITRIFPRFGQMGLYALGSPYGDTCTLAVDPSLSEADRTAATTCLIDALEAYGAETGTPLIAFKDLPDASSAETTELLRARGFSQLQSLPLAVLDLPYKTVDDYLASLSSATRKDIRRKLKASQGRVEVERRRGLAGIEADIRALYEATRGASAFDYGDFETLPERYFEAIAETLGENALFMLYRVNGEIAAFNLLLLGKTRIIDKFLGMRPGVAQDHNLYALSWIENVKLCLELGVPELQTGQTAYGLKLRMGSRLEASSIWFKHRNRGLNALLRPLARLLAFDKLDPELTAYRKRQAQRKAGGA